MPLFFVAGLLKVIEVVLSIAAAISASCVYKCNPCGPVSFMQFVSISAIIMTCVLYVVFAFNLQQKTDIINWPLTDLINAVVYFVLYVIASSVLAASGKIAAEKSAVAFGFFCVLLFAASSWFAYKVFIIDYRKRHSTVSHIRGVSDDTETEALS